MSKHSPPNGKYLFLLILVQAFLCHHPCQADSLTDEAASLYEKSKPSVFQIRVIDLATDEKSAMGSGFYISSEGHMATNYHVVADYVMKPDRYRIEHIGINDISENLTLIYFDAVHDLAILLSEKKPQHFLQFGNSQLNKGARIFSMGNPHDLGMTIVEGTFNGLMEKSRYRKILFSGALNPGMSGGPALNHSGEIIGINVSTMGNDVSFLVPVEFLKDLYTRALKEGIVESSAFKELIERQLLDNQNKFIESLLNTDWDHLSISNLLVPGEITESIKCWGKSYDTKKSLMEKVKTTCQSTDNIYLSSKMYTGYYSYWFLFHKSKKLNTFRLYNHLEQDFENAFSFDNLFSFFDADEEDLTKFQCHTDFVNIADRTWKTALCVRQYKEFRQLFDMELILSTVDEFDQGLMGDLIAMGVNQKRGQDLIKKFLGEILWQK